MLRRSTRTILVTAGVVSVLGAGVAVAADTPTCPYGNTPRAAQTQSAAGDTTRLRLRERDGTGPRHEQRSQRRAGGRQARGQGRHHGQGHGARDGSGNPTCPYRS